MTTLAPSELESARRYHRERANAQRAKRESKRAEWLEAVQSAVNEVAPRFPGLKAVYLFGGLAKAGRFHARSDIDLAVVTDSVETESMFWARLERAFHPR